MTTRATTFWAKFSYIHNFFCMLTHCSLITLIVFLAYNQNFNCPELKGLSLDCNMLTCL